jgi:hypothetical protein
MAYLSELFFVLFHMFIEIWKLWMNLFAYVESYFTT